jgi:hypothetical protein
MPINCTFALNSRPLTTLSCPGVGNFAAFSGMPADRNNPAAVAHADSGPLPQGRYYIVDRESGGHLGWLYDYLRTYGYGTNRNEWFALYRKDEKVDDITFVKGVRRGAFRLHPIGPQRRSEGCIALASPAQFKQLSTYLRSTGPALTVPGTTVKAYGTVEVR